MVTDSQIVVTEQCDHPYKEGSSLFRFHISVANIVQSSVLSRSKFNINVHHQAMHAQVNKKRVVEQVRAVQSNN